MLHRCRLAPNQDPLQLQSLRQGNEAGLDLADGRTLLVLHADSTGKLSWPDKYIRLWAPNSIVCCYPMRARYANPQWAPLIFGDWDEATWFGISHDKTFALAQPRSEYEYNHQEEV